MSHIYYTVQIHQRKIPIYMIPTEKIIIPIYNSNNKFLDDAGIDMRFIL